MGWKEPSNNKDPWTGGSGDQGPPDLGEVAKKIKQQINRLFGAKGGGPSSDGGGNRGGGNGGEGPDAGDAAAPYMWLLIAGGLVIALAWEMLYVIQPAERGLVLRFGRYATTLSPGLSLRMPRPIEHVERVNIDQIRAITHSAHMLTQDENIVEIELAVQYKLKDAPEYKFNVFDPETTLKQATESAVRSVIGKNKLDYALTEGRAEIAANTRDTIQGILDYYKSGLQVTSVNMQPARPPDEVKSAFDDAIKAREDEQRLINEAESYRNEIIPRARGEAARVGQDALAYKYRAVALAEGDAARFTQIAGEYAKAPDITRQRLYIDAVQSVLSGSSKVLLDTKSGNNLVYLPLDKITEHSKSLNLEGRPAPPAPPVPQVQTAPAAAPVVDDDPAPRQEVDALRRRERHQ
jgi:membrane protease subunit HflK